MKKLFKWHESYDEAYAYLCQHGYSWYPYGSMGYQYHDGLASSIGKGNGASKHLFYSSMEK